MYEYKCPNCCFLNVRTYEVIRLVCEKCEVTSEHPSLKKIKIDQEKPNENKINSAKQILHG